VTASILERGHAAGAFGVLFGVDLVDPARREHYRRMVGDLVVGYLARP
jgi:hypothetical protein